MKDIKMKGKESCSRSISDSQEDKGLTRREALKKVGKAVYVAPVLMVLTPERVNADHTISHLPPPPI